MFKTLLFFFLPMNCESFHFQSYFLPFEQNKKGKEWKKIYLEQSPKIEEE